jgi:hypothetical protein
MAASGYGGFDLAVATFGSTVFSFESAPPNEAIRGRRRAALAT